MSADCAKMKGLRLRQRASFNVKVHSTLVLYSRVRRGGFKIESIQNQSGQGWANTVILF